MQEIATTLFLLVMIVMESQGNGCIGQLSGWQYALIPLAGGGTSQSLYVYSVESDVLIVRVLNAGNRDDIYKSYQ